jgi:hypothetical protein
MDIENKKRQINGSFLFFIYFEGAGSFFPPPLSLAAAINVAANQRASALSQFSPTSQHRQMQNGKKNVFFRHLSVIK